MQRISRYYETARYLRAGQLAHWAWRRALGRSYRIPDVGLVTLRPGVTMVPPIPPRRTIVHGDEFRFLNVGRRFAHGIDWRSPDQSKLWRYNLHYFDYALDPGCPVDRIETAIADWILRNPPTPTDGWEPYPVSLRIVNWVKFALARVTGQLSEKAWLTGLFRQLAWLEHNLEHEILANHLLKNAKALFFGGAFFAGPAAERWLETGRRLLLREATDQILADGGHYERSLMYHAIALEDLLDVLNLASASPGLLQAEDTEVIASQAHAALQFMEEVAYPDGELPLFNDAAFGVAASIAGLVEYGGRVVGYRPLAKSSGPRAIDKPDTGYFGYRDADDMLLIDAGPLGPDYQPGHGHCDFLSFELVLNRQRVVVDSGVFGYDADALRCRIRGTAAHNTVQIDGQEQSDIWGSFRVGRRARVIGVGLASRLPDGLDFRAAHDGYRFLTGRPTHERRISYRFANNWTVSDRISGSGRHKIESIINIHPDLHIGQADGTFAISRSDGQPICLIRPHNGMATLAPSLYCPEFGLRQEGQAIRITLTADLPASLGYTIERP